MIKHLNINRTPLGLSPYWGECQGNIGKNELLICSMTPLPIPCLRKLTGYTCGWSLGLPHHDPSHWVLAVCLSKLLVSLRAQTIFFHSVFQYYTGTWQICGMNACMNEKLCSQCQKKFWKECVLPFSTISMGPIYDIFVSLFVELTSIIRYLSVLLGHARCIVESFVEISIWTGLATCLGFFLIRGTLLLLFTTDRNHGSKWKIYINGIK